MIRGVSLAFGQLRARSRLLLMVVAERIALRFTTLHSSSRTTEEEQEKLEMWSIQNSVLSLLLLSLLSLGCTGQEPEPIPIDSGSQPSDAGTEVHCLEECADVDGCEAIYGYRWNEECYEYSFADCGVPAYEPDGALPIEDPDGNCWRQNWKMHPAGWEFADENSPCWGLKGNCDD